MTHEAPADKMHAVVCLAPGELRLTQRAVPAHRENDFLIRVRRVGVCGTDMHIYRGSQPYLQYPRIMGHELAGEVVEAPASSTLQAGDPVYVMPYLSCGSCIACRRGKPNCCVRIEVLGVHRDGGLAEFLVVPAQFVASAAGLSFDEAAMVEFLAIGAHAVRRAQVVMKQRVLVVGAGPIGIAVALFAKLAGAIVTALDTRPERIDFCREVIGVDHAVAQDGDSSAKLTAITAGENFDAVFDATGNSTAMIAGFSHVAHGGCYVLVSIVAADITFSDPEFHKRETTLLASRNATPEDFAFVVDAIRQKKVPTAAFNTHKATLRDLADVFPGWMEPSAGVIKAIVEC